MLICVLLMPLLATFCPACGQSEGVRCILFFAGVGRALIEQHGDITSDGRLNFHAELGGEHGFGAINVVGKFYSLF